MPFFLFVLGIIGVGLYFFTQNALERGVENAARQIRTGQAQNAAMTVSQFKTMLCTRGRQLHRLRQGQRHRAERRQLEQHHSDILRRLQEQYGDLDRERRGT